MHSGQPSREIGQSVKQSPDTSQQSADAATENFIPGDALVGQSAITTQQYGGLAGKRLRVFFIFSLILLGVLLAASVIKLMGTGKRYSDVQKAQLLRSADEWIIQFDIINRESRAISYTIDVTVDGHLSTVTISIPEGQSFPYIKRIRQDILTGGIVSLAIYKEGQSDPVENIIYHLAE